MVEADQYLLLGMHAERMTGYWKALDLEGGLAHTGVCPCPCSSDGEENLCVSLYVNFTLKKNAADRKCGAEGLQSMQSIVAEPSRGGR